jgi:hypothetical protein
LLDLGTLCDKDQEKIFLCASGHFILHT